MRNRLDTANYSITNGINTRSLTSSARLDMGVVILIYGDEIELYEGTQIYWSIEDPSNERN